MANHPLRDELLLAFHDRPGAKTTDELVKLVPEANRRAAEREIPLLIQAGFLEVTKDFKLRPADEE